MTHAVLKKGWNENDLNGLAGKQAETYSPDRTVVTVIPRRSDDRDQRSQSSEALASVTINSDAATLGRAAAVVGLRGDVGDRPHLEACGLQRTDRGLAT